MDAVVKAAEDYRQDAGAILVTPLKKRLAGTLAPPAEGYANATCIRTLLQPEGCVPGATSLPSIIPILHLIIKELGTFKHSS
jgi:hypothetical protein